MKVEFNWRDYDDYSKWLQEVLTTLYEENQQLKKQKDDVVEFLKYSLYTYCQEDAELYEETRIKILRMLGEIDVED